MTNWTAADIPDQTGRLAVITGGTSGLGLVTATQLALRGAQVVLAARDPAAGERAVATIGAVAGGPSPVHRQLDLASLTSVREFVAWVGDEYERVDLLVNNAGAESFGPRRVTADGFEFHLGTNALGHFALTGLLLPALTRGRAARVVSLSSITHRRAHLDLDDLQMERGFTGLRAYGASKLAATVLGLELDRRLRAVQSPVLSVLAHPGVARTALTARALEGRPRLVQALGRAFTSLATQSADQGSLPQLHAATALGVRGGDFFGPDGRGEQRGAVTRVQPSREAADPELGTELWEAAQALTGVTYLAPGPTAAQLA